MRETEPEEEPKLTRRRAKTDEDKAARLARRREKDRARRAESTTEERAARLEHMGALQKQRVAAELYRSSVWLKRHLKRELRDSTICSRTGMHVVMHARKHTSRCWSRSM